MLKVPPAVMQKFDRLLVNSDITPEEYPAYRKWLRFYLDFCKKYRHGYADPASLSLFVEKLKSKNQDSFQLEQARAAVGLYYSGLGKNEPDNPTVPDAGQAVPEVEEEKAAYAAGRKKPDGTFRLKPWQMKSKSGITQRRR